jgi:hypothetical protein
VQCEFIEETTIMAKKFATREYEVGINGVEATNGSESGAKRIVIAPLNFQTIRCRVEGTAPFVQLRFSQKARQTIRDKMESGTRATKKDRQARDFAADYEASMYESDSGQRGIPAPAFRNSCIRACALVGFQMTTAKCSIFFEADGYDKYDRTPLVYIENGEPHQYEAMVRNATGVVDLRVRAMWETWSAVLTIRFDADQFSASDVVNLLNRAGQQVGVGEGRPFSKNSNGTGFGTFRVVTESAEA